MDLDIKGKVALVTGGSRGLGKQIALALAKEGCKVAICSRNTSEFEQVLRQIKEFGIDKKTKYANKKFFFRKYKYFL